MLDVKEISRSFSGKPVLNEVSFTVSPGRMTGFVGANGAGKTTTMRIILGVLSADGGSVTLNGAKVGKDDRRRFGYMPEERGLYPKMKVAEQITYLGKLHGMSTGAARASAYELLDRLDLTSRANDEVEKLSLGNQQRAQIAAALVHKPDVLILDEPFSGLDPIAVEAVQTVLKEYASGGVPVLFSSHQLDIVERLCDDLVIIAGGSIRASGEREALREAHSEPRYEIQLDTDAGWIRDVPGVNVVSFDGGYALFDAPDPAAAQQVLRTAIQHGSVDHFTPHRPPLAQIFKEVIE